MTAGGARAVVVGGGVAGWVAATLLARAGYTLTLFDEGTGCSAAAGGMLAPVCEVDHAEPEVVRAGLDAVARWQDLLGDRAEGCLQTTGSVLVAHRPEWPLLKQLADRAERAGFGDRLTALDRAGLRSVEPALADRFARGWLVQGEGSVHPRRVLPALREGVRADVRAERVIEVSPHTVRTATDTLTADVVVDARGLGAQPELPLRGVRGEYLIVHCPDVVLTRPTRLQHPRYPLYVVPRPDGQYYLGATQVERDDDGPTTVRSALELLSALFSISPAFGDASVLEMGVGLRPAMPNNQPLLTVEPGLARLNGLFRHGFLLAPTLAHALVAAVRGDAVDEAITPFAQVAA